jgi:hypothetical protein
MREKKKNISKGKDNSDTRRRPCAVAEGPFGPSTLPRNRIRNRRDSPTYEDRERDVAETGGLQLLPPSRSEQEWERARNGRRKKKNKPWNVDNDYSDDRRIQGNLREYHQGSERNRTPPINIEALRKRLPKTSAIAVTRESLGNLTCAEALKKARQAIPLEDIGVEISKVRRSAMGGLIIEVTGDNAPHKADTLASRMTEVLRGKGIRIARPVRRADI